MGYSYHYVPSISSTNKSRDSHSKNEMGKSWQEILWEERSEELDRRKAELDKKEAELARREEELNKRIKSLKNEENTRLED